MLCLLKLSGAYERSKAVLAVFVQMKGAKMSLAEQYKEIVDSENRAEKEKERLQLIQKVLRECGLSEEHVQHCNVTLPVQLTSDAVKLFEEAIQLINADRWKVYKRLSADKYEYKMPFVSIKDDARYFKYKWEDGSVHYGEFASLEDGYVSGWQLKSKIKNEARRIVEVANAKRTKLEPYLFGSQEYVILHHYLDYRHEWYCKYYLFKDGILFKDASKGVSSRIEGVRIFGNANDPEGTPLDTWLLENIKRINTGIDIIGVQ